MCFQNAVNATTLVTLRSIGVGEHGSTWPPEIWGKYFSGNYYVKFRHFSGKNHVKLGNFVIFSGKNRVKFGHFDNFSHIFFGQKCRVPLKLTELLRRCCAVALLATALIEMSY